MGKAPLTHTFETDADATAIAADSGTVVCVAPYAGTVTAATYTAIGAVTGAATDTRTINIINKGASGSGTTVVATLALVSGVNLVAFDEKALTLSSVAGATTVAAGDVLAFTSVHGGSTGLADPGGLVTVKLSRTA